MTANIKDAIKKRQCAWSKGNIVQYNMFRNKVSRLCKNARSSFYNNSIANMQETNPKKWWDNIKLLSGLSKPPSLTKIHVDGAELKDGELAEALNDCFTNVTSDIQPLDFTPVDTNHSPDEYVITPESVEKALLSIKERKSNDPDDIPNWVLKNFASVIYSPRCSLFNSSINEGYVPSLWKCANVIPINKVPRPTSINTDFRPFSLTPVLSKILDGFVFEWLAAIIMPNIDPYQYGYVKKSSTTHALVHLIHHWLNATEAPNTVIRSCLINFSKAFDRIDHTILLHKLQLFNTPQVLLNWCANFLTNRKQHVCLNSFSSPWKHVHAGVPQGTKLGPLFFLVMVNDLRTDLPLYKYVDHCTIYEVVTKGESSILQNELNKIIEWTNSNNMKINVTKTKELSISFLKNSLPAERLMVNNQSLDPIRSSKLLGVNLSTDLKWSIHIDEVCARASKRLFALRTLKRNGVPVADLRSVYCYFIRPLLEYACPVWHSSLTCTLNNQLEGIQRRALRIIYPQMSYKDSITQFNLPTLYDRPELLCESFYKNATRPDSKLFNLLPEPTPSHYNLRKPSRLPLFKCRTKRFKNSFIPSSVAKWD